MSRILIGVIGVLLLIIPWSERYSALDSFPRGHDTELSVLAFFVMLGLILLFVRSARKRLQSMLAVSHWLRSIISPAVSLLPNCRHIRPLTDPHRPPPLCSSLELCKTPLRI